MTECWCGMDHRYLDYDDDGQSFDVRDIDDLTDEPDMV
jgi:hypothetical protein